MKPGRFRFSVPNPYVTQEPIEGRPNRVVPVFIIITDGPWLGMSVMVDRTWQNSSIVSAIRGKISLTAWPLRPYFANANGERIRFPVVNSVRGVA